MKQAQQSGLLPTTTAPDLTYLPKNTTLGMTKVLKIVRTHKRLDKPTNNRIKKANDFLQVA